MFELGVPVLGICYGEQTMVAQLGGRVEGSSKREFGRADIEVVGQSKLFDGVWALGAADHVWMSHGDRVIDLPPGFHAIAVSRNAPFAAIADETRRFYGAAVPSRGRAHPARRRRCLRTSCRTWPASRPTGA